MIDAKTLKKHNLKAVPFSAIKEGESFYLLLSGEELGDRSLERRLLNGHIPFVDNGFGVLPASYISLNTVYVPVWRVTDRQCSQISKANKIAGECSDYNPKETP